MLSPSTKDPKYKELKKDQVKHPQNWGYQHEEAPIEVKAKK